MGDLGYRYVCGYVVGPWDYSWTEGKMYNNILVHLIERRIMYVCVAVSFRYVTSESYNAYYSLQIEITINSMSLFIYQ